MLSVIVSPQPGAENGADPDALQVIDNVGGWLADALNDAAQRRDTPALLRHARDRALLLMLFWRRVSAAELVGVRIERLTIDPRLGLSCDVPGRHGPRQVNWRPISRPSLRHLCPLRAVRLWLDVARRDSGPLFPCLERGGDLTRVALPADSVLPLLLGLVERSDGCARTKSADAIASVDLADPSEVRQPHGQRARGARHGVPAHGAADRPTCAPLRAGRATCSSGERPWTR